MTSKILKSLVTGAFVRHAGYWALARRRRAMAALCYHRVSNEIDPLGLAVCESDFARQMQALANSAHLAPVSATRFFELWSGREEYGARVPLLVSFDDGFQDNISVAAPILKRYGIPAIMFVASDVVAGKPLWYDLIAQLVQAGMAATLHEKLTALDIPCGSPELHPGKCVEMLRHLPGATFERALAAIQSLALHVNLAGRYVGAADLEQWVALGMEVGAHTCSHPCLAAIHPVWAEREMIESKRFLEHVLAREVAFFAYPFGGSDDFTAEHCQVLARSGYRMAFTTVQGGNQAGDDPFTVRRKCVVTGLFARPGSTFSETLFLADVMGLGADLKERLRGAPRWRAESGKGRSIG